MAKSNPSTHHYNQTMTIIKGTIIVNVKASSKDHREWHDEGVDMLGAGDTVTLIEYVNDELAKVHHDRFGDLFVESKYIQWEGERWRMTL